MAHSFFSLPSSMILTYLTSLGVLVAVVSADPSLTAILDYGTFEGAYSSFYNINYWMKIPFAAQPVGNNRFRAPQPPIPIPNATVYNSTQGYGSCPQQFSIGTEDCLYLGLYSRPWSPPQALRPVVVNFYGGGFAIGGGSFSVTPTSGPPCYPTLNISSSNDFVFMVPNYRVNAFGFLPGAQIAADPTSDLNVGLLDQHAALEWTQKYIKQFGGDPTNVAIWGQSAGGGSVVAQAIAFGGKVSPPLFNKALASSPYWPKTYRYDAPEAQAVYDKFASLVGCSGSDSLTCLKAADVQNLTTAATAITWSQQYTTTSFTWAPVIGDSFLPQPLSNASLNGDVNFEFGFGMYNALEGESFLPNGLNSYNSTGIPQFNSSQASFENWLRGFLPDFSDTNIKLVKKMYPANGTTGQNDTNYLRAQFIYRDLVLACPAFWLASSAPSAGYIGKYAILPATHGSDIAYWGFNDTQLQNSSDVTYLGYTGALASFLEIGDPNAKKLTDSTVLGVPELNHTQQEWVVLPGGVFGASFVGNETLGLRCDFWRSVAANVPV